MATVQLSDVPDVVKKGTANNIPDQAKPEDYNNIAIDGKGGVGNPDQRKPDDTSQSKVIQLAPAQWTAATISGTAIGAIGAGYLVHNKLKKGWFLTTLSILAGGIAGGKIAEQIDPQTK